MAVVGAKEVEANALNIRTRAQGELGALPVTEVVERVAGAIATREDF
jgi:threonyl-tRNA synthetase